MFHFILQAAAILSSLSQPGGDAIPDFSRVGYHFGDREIPTVEVVKTIQAPSDGSDATRLIQNAIDAMTGPGAILLKAGTYNVSKSILVNKNGIVLRGEGDATRLIATQRKQHSFIKVGEKIDRKLLKTSSRISAKYTPVGQMWVEVEDAKKFAAGDRVVIFRPGTKEWIADLKMDQIPDRSEKDKATQWTATSYSLYWERTVLEVKGDKLYFDNPVVMAIDAHYGGGEVIKCTTERLAEIGIENMHLESVFDPELKDKQGRWIDENHAWTAISVNNLEHGWIRNVSSKYFGYALFSLTYGARNITVENCRSEMPVSQVSGGRRYAFNISANASLNLVKNCVCDNDRHGCVTGARVCGPNVFLDCKGVQTWSDFGPHHRWSTGVLYDRVVTDNALNVQDRSNWGSGHGWAGANFVLWNCEAAKMACQNPWVSAVNWAVGCVAPIAIYKKNAKEFVNCTRSHADGLQRPDCIRYSQGSHVEEIPSLYYYQLEKRHAEGIWLDK